MPRLATALVLGLSVTTLSAELTPNVQGSPQELKSTSDVCAGRSEHCSVLLDVPQACAGASSACPIGFFYHGHGGNNGGFAHSGAGMLCHEYGFIGVYPQGELYGGRSGWNDGSMEGNKCQWDDFACQEDPNDGNFTVAMLRTVHALGGRGNVYMWGGSNGANAVQILAANADAKDLPIAGISAGWGQLMATPPRSGPAPYDWNQPTPKAGQTVAGRPGDGRRVAQQAHHGDADRTIPYQGGPRFDSPVWVLMPEPDSDATWAAHNDCTGGLTNTSGIPATYHDKASGKQVATTATLHQYHGCPPEAPVEYYQIIGAPHGGASSINGKDPYYIVFDFWSKVENSTAPTPAPPPTPPTPAPPTPPPTPAQPTPPPTPGGGSVPAACIAALQAACPGLQGKGEPCDECVKAHQHTPSVQNPCKVNPFHVTEVAFCGSR